MRLVIPHRGGSQRMYAEPGDLLSRTEYDFKFMGDDAFVITLFLANNVTVQDRLSCKRSKNYVIDHHHKFTDALSLRVSSSQLSNTPVSVLDMCLAVSDEAIRVEDHRLPFVCEK